MQNSFGIYVHIPYCLQRCSYCDFATYVQTEIIPPEKYIELLKKEISNHSFIFSEFKGLPLKTLYFGGGTPSLIPAELIIDVISALANHGFATGPQTEISLEINPATVSEKKLNQYLAAGFNRFSVGAQTFSDRLLKSVNREHNAKQTLETLALLKKYSLNFSFDLLFALPTQTLAELKDDLKTAVELGSAHISPYCLTVPEGHPLSFNRAPDEEQIEMFQEINASLLKNQFQRYEISNYARSGFESQHNLLYWTDQPYWGLGLSAHSYSKNPQTFQQNTPWGARFWNASNIKIYEQNILTKQAAAELKNFEILKKHQSLTDFCYTSLRLSRGLNFFELEQKFGSNALATVEQISKNLVEKKILFKSGANLCLSEKGFYISNQIFEKFAFLEEDHV